MATDGEVVVKAPPTAEMRPPGATQDPPSPVARYGANEVHGKIAMLADVRTLTLHPRPRPG